jgi:hypothetical protein
MNGKGCQNKFFCHNLWLYRRICLQGLKGKTSVKYTTIQVEVPIHDVQKKIWCRSTNVYTTFDWFGEVKLQICT